MSPELREIAIRVLILCAGVTWLVMLWRADRNPLLKKFSMVGFITTKDGFPDRPGMMELGSWAAMTIFMLIITLHDKMTEAYMTIYIGFPMLRAGQGAWLHATSTQLKEDAGVKPGPG